MIFTFYSFKGGVGRSMALANIAELLYQRDLRVLMVDFDLEAPGLERYFDNQDAILKPDEVCARRGVVDMLLSFKELRELPKPANGEPERLITEPLNEFVAPICRRPGARGSISLIPAGRRAGDEFKLYAERVRSFDWDEFYLNLEGERFIRWLYQEMESVADVVLVDSRTGVSEISGVCTHKLADCVVSFVATNQQNIDGVYRVAMSLRNRKGPSGSPISLVFVPSRVENSEGVRLNEIADDFEAKFNNPDPKERLFPPALTFAGKAWLDLRVPYVAHYSVYEKVATREKQNAISVDLVKAFETLASALSLLAPHEHRLYLAYHSEAPAAARLAKIAEEVFTKLTPDQQKVAETALLRLIRVSRPGDVVDDSTVKVKSSLWAGAARDAIEAMAAGGALTISVDAAGGSIVEFADTGLIKDWKRLGDWIEKDRAFLYWRQKLAGQAAEWETGGKQDSALLRGPAFEEARKWLEKRPDALSPSESQYILASAPASERLSRIAEEILSQRDPELQKAAGMALLRLVRVSRPGAPEEDTAVTAKFSVWTGPARQVIDALVTARVITTSFSPLTGDVAEFADTGLISDWKRLRDRIASERVFLFWRQGLSAQAEAWGNGGKKSSALLRGAALVEAKQWLSLRRDDLNPSETEYIEAGAGRQWREYVSAGAQWIQTLGVPALPYLLAAALISFVGSVLPDSMKIALHWWPEPDTQPWHEPFVVSNGEWQPTNLWDYPKGQWKPVSTVSDSEGVGVLVTGSQIGFARNVNFYDFGMALKIGLEDLKKAAWILRAQPDKGLGYLFELQKDSSFILSGYLMKSGGFTPLGRGVEIPIKSCCVAGDSLLITGTIEGNQFSYSLALQNARADPDNPDYGREFKAMFTDSKSSIRYGTVGFLERDPGARMVVDDLQIIPR